MTDDNIDWSLPRKISERPLVPQFPLAWHGKEPPPREWMVEDCFVKGTVGLISGDGGIGKSLLMQELCSCAAMGRNWLGLKVEPGKAVVLACEDDEDELWRRQVGICRYLGCDLDEIGEAGLVLWPGVGEDNTLMRVDRSNWEMRPTRFFQEFRGFIIRHGIQYVVIDTATQTFSGNQNDERHVMQYINALRKLAVAANGVVILTKHPSLTGRNTGTGESGNVAWNNSVRSRFYLHKDKQSGQLLFECKKSNYGKQITKTVRWEQGVYVVDEPTYRAPYND